MAPLSSPKFTLRCFQSVVRTHDSRSSTGCFSVWDAPISQIINLNLMEKLSCAVCARTSGWNVQKMSAESQLAQVALSPLQKVKLESLGTRTLANCKCICCRTIATAFNDMIICRLNWTPGDFSRANGCRVYGE